MENENIVKFMEGEIENLQRAYLVNEANYRVFTSMVMARAKPSDELLNQQTQTKANKEGLENKIRQMKGLLEEIKSEKFLIP